jgi:hypothetical protein
MNIDTAPYLEYSLALTPTELDTRNRLMDFLPDTIIDCHAHCNLPQHVQELDSGVFGHMMSTFPGFSLEDSHMVKETLYVGKRVLSLRFANAYRGINHRAANQYLLDNSPKADRVALYGIPDDIAYTTAMLRCLKFTGLKMYYQYFNPPAQTIYQVFPPEILEEAQAQNVPIILHLPKMITQSADDLEQVLQDFPRLIVVLAHLGLPHLPVPELMSAYERLSKFPTLFMDTSMIPDPQVTFMALQAFGASRILFGSDEPLNLIRSTVFQHPEKGQRLITEYPYHWIDKKDHRKYRHLAKGATQTHWQVLNAIHQAVLQLPLKVQKRASEAIFHGNARLIFDFD